MTYVGLFARDSSEIEEDVAFTRFTGSALTVTPSPLCSLAWAGPARALLDLIPGLTLALVTGPIILVVVVVVVVVMVILLSVVLSEFIAA